MNTVISARMAAVNDIRRLLQWALLFLIAVSLVMIFYADMFEVRELTSSLFNGCVRGVERLFETIGMARILLVTLVGATALAVASLLAAALAIVPNLQSARRASVGLSFASAALLVVAWLAFCLNERLHAIEGWVVLVVQVIVALVVLKIREEGVSEDEFLSPFGLTVIPAVSLVCQAAAAAVISDHETSFAVFAAMPTGWFWLIVLIAGVSVFRSTVYDRLDEFRKDLDGQNEKTMAILDTLTELKRKEIAEGKGTDTSTV